MVTIHPHHVVVVGGGLAGCTAALEALQRGRKVTLIDKTKLGGNSAKATSGMNAAETNWQQQKHIKDSIELFTQDILKSGQGLTRYDLALSVAAHSAQGLKFVEKVLGSDLSEVAILGAHSVPRTHRLYSDKPVPLGFLVMSAYKKVLDPARWDGMLVLRENTSVVDLDLTIDNRGLPVITGVVVHDSNNDQRETINANSVVLASGGFAADVGPHGLVARHNSFAGLCPFTTNGAFATGDLLKIAQSLNLGTIDLDQIQLHPTGFIDLKDPMAGTKFLCPEVVRGSGALLLNRTASRFVNELERRDIVSKAIFTYGAKPTEWGMELKDGNDETNARCALLLLDDVVCEKVGPAIGFYKSKGFIQEFENLEALAKSQGWDYKQLEQMISNYNKKAKAGITDEFGKSVYPSDFSSILSGKPAYMAYVTPSVHYCMGGLRTNAQLQVLTADDNERPVINLFAAGEIMGGLHGKNRLGGNGMMESATFGMLAGRNAAELVRATGRALKPGSSYVLDGVVEIMDQKVIRIAFKNLYDSVDCTPGTKLTLKTLNNGIFSLPVSKGGMGFVEFNYLEGSGPPEWKTKQPHPGTPISVLAV